MTEAPKKSLPTLEEVDTYPIPHFLAARIAEVHKVSLLQAMDMIREAKRMLYLCNLSKEAVVPTDIVDMAWHEMLMFSKWYREFCTFIGGYLDHDPTPPEEKEAFIKEAKEKGLKESPAKALTRANYKKYLKIDPDPRYWS